MKPALDTLFNDGIKDLFNPGFDSNNNNNSNNNNRILITIII